MRPEVLKTTKEVQCSPLGISAEVLGTDIGMDAAFGVSLERGGGGSAG